jgi:hypothetical protein
VSVQRELIDMLDGLAGAVAEIRAALVAGAWQRMGDYAEGPPSSRLDAGPGGGGISDPTARAALSRSRFLAHSHQETFRAALTEASRGLSRASAVAALYPAIDPSAVLTLAKGDPGCESCSRVDGPRGPRWEPTHPKLSGRTDVAGRLARARHLCSWCYDKVLAWDRLPTREELELHHQGRRVPWPADVARPKEAG